MSGFAVEFRRDGRDAAIESANRMRGGLQIFGSDRRNALADGPFAICWVQSAGFTPQDPHERQPVGAQDRWHVLFLGRLNHRAELAEKVGLSTVELERTPDCDLAMMAWCKWGENCRDHLYGGYSLVVCDTKESRLIAIRSPERSQHIFYYSDADRLILSTSTKAIFAFPDIPREIDELKIADTLVLNHQDTERSFFKGVSVLGQAHTMVAGVGNEPRISYHDFLAEVEPIRLARDEDYVEQARELTDAAIASAFRTPGRPAISLSAGLDSTTIAVMMIETLRREGIAEPGILKAYTGVPEQGWDGRTRENWLGDESGPVRALAAMYPEIDVEFVSGESFAFDQQVDMIQSYADMPIRGVGNSAWGAAIRQNCRRDRHSVLVSGSAGNGTISFAASHILFAKWFRGGRWGELLREARRFVAKRPGASLASVLGQSAITNLPDALYDRYMRFRGHDATTGFHAFSPIHPEFAQDVNVGQRLSDLGWDDRYRRRPSRQEMMRIMLQQGARNDGGGLQEASKVMSGVETVSALEDRKLMAFCYAIPDDQFYRDGVDRLLVKNMMRGKLPQEVMNAPRGEQASDWHSRRKRDLDRISAELDRLADIPEIAGRIDIARMQRVNKSWPDETPVSPADYHDYAIARYGIGRAIAIARFINQVEGRN